MKRIRKGSVGRVPRRGSAARPGVCRARRAVGGLYLALGAALVGIGWLLADQPGIFNASSPRYEVPHACAGLECLHGYVSGPNGELYCAKHPPKEFLDARMSGPSTRTRLTLGAVFGFGGLCLVVSTMVAGFLWLLGLWLPEKPVRWYTVACRAAPFLAVGCWVTACALKAIYPPTPM